MYDISKHCIQHALVRFQGQLRIDTKENLKICSSKFSSVGNHSNSHLHSVQYRTRAAFKHNKHSLNNFSHEKKTKENLNNHCQEE